MPLDSQGERVTLECMRGTSASVWQMSAERFGDNDPLRGGFRITQARFSVRFRLSGKRGSRTLPVTVTMPEGCDLKDRTKREQLIGRKYLARWGLVAEV